MLDKGGLLVASKIKAFQGGEKARLSQVKWKSGSCLIARVIAGDQLHGKKLGPTFFICAGGREHVGASSSL